MTELNKTALEAAYETLAMPDHPDQRRPIADAIRAYLAALPAPSSDGLCERLEKRAGHIEAWGGYEDGNLHREAADALRSRDARIAELEAEVANEQARSGRLLAALKAVHDAVAEFYRYWTGGETRGSYDGKPEREGLWRAMYAARASLTKEQTDGE